MKTSNYLERNKKIFEELRKSRLVKGAVLGNSDTGTAVYSLGSFNSETFGRELYVCLKQGSKYGEVSTQFSLALIKQIERRFPHLLPEFPIFYGVLQNPQGLVLGALMEDFSNGGVNKLEDMYDNDVLPIELSEAFGHKISPCDLATACFKVNGQRRMGDFEELIGAASLGVSKLDRYFPTSSIARRMSEFTLNI